MARAAQFLRMQTATLPELTASGRFLARMMVRPPAPGTSGPFRTIVHSALNARIPPHCHDRTLPVELIHAGCTALVMIPAPATYEGPFSGLFGKYVEPNLPSVARVGAFDDCLRRYLGKTDAIHIVRAVASLTRGQVARGAPGGLVLPTDNSPVWWLHSFLLSDAAFPPDFGQFLSELPCHMFHLPNDRQYLNSAGYHAAHILNAKDGNTDWRHWSDEELVRRTLVNIHPCNMFLLAKTGWRENGARRDILQWTAREYVDRYGPVMLSLLADAGVKHSPSNGGVDPTYKYQPGADKGARIRPPGSTPRVKQGNKLIKHLKRPHIMKSLVGTGTLLDIKTDYGHFRIYHDDLLAWVSANLNALNTHSWIDKGNYHWPRASSRMIDFLRGFQV